MENQCEQIGTESRAAKVSWECNVQPEATGSYVFMKPNFSGAPSWTSMKSDQSMEIPLAFGRGKDFSDPRVHQQQLTGQTGQSGQTGHKDEAHLASIFTSLEENIVTFVKTELKRLQGVLSPDPEAEAVDELEDEEEEERRKSSRQALLKILLNFLRSMKQEEMADCLQSKTLTAVCQSQLKNNLKGRFHCFFEGIANAGKPTLLNEIYTELYITEGGAKTLDDGHEIRATPQKRSRPETLIRCEDIFQPLPGKDQQPVRLVMTKGEAGMGKTVLTHKFSLDWAEDKANRSIQFTFPLTFRELNLLGGKKYSLVELLHLFFTETKDAELYRFNKYRVVFILDGLDECRLPLDFHNNEVLTDVTKPSTVDVLLTNLIAGKLLPSARLWITTRPAAANQIPPEYVDVVTEVRGFTDPQKEEYFRKRFREGEQSNRIIAHIKKSRSLHVMCHIPVFCWITATVLENIMKSQAEQELPKTLTEMYIHFLVVQSIVGNIKYRGLPEMDDGKIIMSLGKLAFEHLQKGNLIFYESDLRECNIDVRAASVFSGVFTQIFKEERGLYQERVYCFVHLSFQEFLAALYVFVTFNDNGINLLSEPRPRPKWSLRDKSKVSPLHQSAVDKTVQSPNGHLDLFLRFLLGLSLENNQNLLRKLLTTPGGVLQSNQETVKYIIKKIRKNPSPERCINLFHCLNELNDNSLVEEIQQFLSSGSLSTDKLTPALWSALVFILLSSEKDLEVFDLRKYSASEEGLLRLLPVVKASRISLLRDCKLSERSCEALTCILRSKSSSLRELDLSYNDLQDSGVKLLLVGLESPDCRLETLRLSDCGLTDRSCDGLASVLSSQFTCLKELDVSNNKLHDLGVKVLATGAASPRCRLETLRLSDCFLTKRSCGALALVLSSPSSNLRQLDLSNSNLQDHGVKLLSAGLASPHCRLEVLRLSSCLVTEKGCDSLASALRSNPFHLRELDLSYNHPGACGVEQLSAGLEDPQWRLEALCVALGGPRRLKPFMYACEVTLDPNSAHRKLRLHDNNRRVTEVQEEQPYPEHPERFLDGKQVLCKEGLSGSCYWELEFQGRVCVGVTYRGIRRSGDYDECCLGENHKSWGLFCSSSGFSACHDKRTTDVRGGGGGGSSGGCRVGVFLDWPTGILSFYRVSSDTLIHLHTFHCSFTEPLYPAFRFSSSSGSGSGSSVFLCPFEEAESASA